VGRSLGAGALKLGCGQVREVVLPVACDPWDRAADLLRRGESIVEAGQLMCDAYALAPDEKSEVFAWWAGRLR
jgi:hypothetical protein